MTRHKFNGDLAQASQEQVKHISGLRKGDDDGELTFVLSHDALPSPLNICLTALNVDDYPHGFGFVAYTKEESVPSGISKVLDDIPNLTQGKTILNTLVMISKKLSASLDSANDDEDTDIEMTDIEDDEHYDEDEDEDEDYEYDGTDFGLDFGGAPALQASNTPSHSAKYPSRLIDDLQKAKDAGFKISLLSDAATHEKSCIFALSLLVEHLGISEDTLEAWEISASDYIVLLYKYDVGYPCMETFLRLPPGHSESMQFRLGKCASFKPTLSSALIPFQKNLDTAKKRSEENGLPSKNSLDAPFCSMPISESLDIFLSKEFTKLLKTRLDFGVSWDRAKEMMEEMAKEGHYRVVNSTQNSSGQNPGPASDSLTDNEAQVSTAARKSLNKDFVRQNPQDFGPSPREELSMPLIAMQFALRYFVKSTQYCLVCHRKTEPGFTALKPYVCNDPLCLFQYMALGMGPSIEHDIINRPYVVDLLVSFCAAALTSGRIREWPRGLSIKVPVPSQVITPGRYAPGNPMSTMNALQAAIAQTPIQPPIQSQMVGSAILVWAQISAGNFNVRSSQRLEGVRPGDMVILVKHVRGRDGKDTNMHHCRIKSANTICDDDGNDCGKSFKFDRLISTDKPTQNVGIQQTFESQFNSEYIIDDEVGDAELYLYDHDLDDLDETYQREALLILVQTIPPIRYLREFLLGHRGWSLAKYEMMSKSSLALLRWIVASNRSLIVQIDQPVDLDIGGIKATEERQKERFVGLGDDWMQFRFAQGSPEKENRFKQELEKEASRKYPTMFAWHGSPLGNWHSIIRTGLNFKEMLHGRAYGHGVYFARDFPTSLSYCSRQANQTSWAGSELKLYAAMSLCEIINRPERFKSINPYYVVDEVDWIQCRYLIIQRNQSVKKEDKPETEPEYIPQDPMWRPVGLGNIRLEIPAAALPKWRQKSTVPGSSRSQPIVLVDDSGEDQPDDFDKIINLTKGKEDDGEDTDEPENDPNKTPFTPGTLDMNTLPQLPAPSWASDTGRKVLGKELSKLQKVQATTPLHQLGWYIDFDNITNMFQWIVELHSFEKSLPLAQDMERAGVSSIVLEIRFGRQFPHSPPFVRVIRPRFLPFSQRGGGHVTAGGAMCMQLLTNSGWSVASSMEGVLLQVSMAICNLEPFPARLERQGAGQLTGGGGGDYGVAEAIEAYKRSAYAHGWQVPPDLHSTANAV
ncbi:polymerase [Colletotrichum phormii]|uniref:Polymerase n=1 Tax=Colletotrichum phormii TaxID=359342 RepID=A0AAI9ZX53_9PEZI|nr:polymerase [Colletotrichum phormii]KAK1639845.1 polymerase [Colletotrichum phormii]